MNYALKELIGAPASKAVSPGMKLVIPEISDIPLREITIPPDLACWFLIFYEDHDYSDEQDLIDTFLEMASSYLKSQRKYQRERHRHMALSRWLTNA